ncbi:caspase family protein [Pseudoalteromonas sp. TAB23]|uniref:caspase family protein n=1 Tax=Pseudoalteromonas sp. TAB23 TaxID=1938595 RepID=UPI00040953C9|nr:caspase family protein [Pseudoalteromonas sp. TAB23]
MNLAVIIGVEKYKSADFDNLLACKNDAKVIGDVLNDVKDIQETLFINDNEAGYEVKRKISELVEKYKGEEIDEFIFYFTGHGDRYDDDFFYLLSDFDLRKRESTGLRNSEVDDWIKTLSPKLFVKIVDACFSGTQYIKSESNTESELKKSAQKYGLNDIYFWFSSRENQTSFAGKEFSRFTESILTAVSEHNGDVRYRDIMASVADDLSKNEDSKPIFVTQADNIEKFGHVTTATHKIIYEAFGLDEPSVIPQTNDLRSPMNDSAVNKEDTRPSKRKETSIFELVKTKSDEICFSEDKLLKFLDSFNENMSSWDADLLSVYEINKESDLRTHHVPNIKEVGNWLMKNITKNYFSKPTYAESTFEVEEYKALPEKPSMTNVSQRLGFNIARSISQRTNTEYKLEKITKTKKYIDGFDYTHSAENRILKFLFKPKIELGQAISLYIVPIYSNTHIVHHVAYEVLTRNNWKSFSSPRCSSWKMIKTNTSSIESAHLVSDKIQTEVKSWIEELFKKSIE